MTPAGPPTGRLAIFPGSFDPLTNGHVDIILRSAHLFERDRRRGARQRGEEAAVHADERVAIIREVFREYPNVEVDTFDGLLVDYARRRRASAIVRGLRAVSDFEYEFQMALMNRHLEPTLETVFMMPAEQYTYLSSRLIKEVFSLGGDVRGLVPPVVEAVDAAEAGDAGARRQVGMQGDQGMFAQRLAQVSASATLKVAAEAERLRRAGFNVVDFSAGEPDFPTPEHVKAAGKAAIDANFTRYTRRPAFPSCARRSARATSATTASTSRRRKCCSPSAASRRSSTPRWRCSIPGDEVITHAPYWPTIPEQVKLVGARAGDRADALGGRVRACTPSAIIAAITPKTKAIIINSPGNPTGALIDEATRRRRSPMRRRSAASGSSSTSATSS